MAKSFRVPKSQDFEIVDNGSGKEEIIGTLRVKPSGILWAPKGSHVWYGINLRQVRQFRRSKRHKTEDVRHQK